MLNWGVQCSVPKMNKYKSVQPVIVIKKATEEREDLRVGLGPSAKSLNKENGKLLSKESN